MDRRGVSIGHGNPLGTARQATKPKDTSNPPERTRVGAIVAANGGKKDMNIPLVIQSLVTEDGRNQPRTVHRRVRVQGPDDDLELRVDLGLFLGRGTDKRDGAGAFTVQTHVL